MSRYQYRADELLVHVDDCGLIKSELAGHGYRAADRRGPLLRFVGEPARRAVPELLAELRARHGTGLRVSPNHVFGCDRIIWGSLRPRPTGRSFPEPPPIGPGERVKVGVVDTGIVQRNGEPHPYIKGRVVYGPDDVDAVAKDVDGYPTGSAGHGTFVTGLIVREAPNAVVHMKGVVDKSSGQVEDLAVADAIDSLRAEGVELINLSFSGSTWEDVPPKAIENALLRLDSSVVVVCAAGNRGTSGVLYPAGIRLRKEPEKGVEPALVIAVGAAVEERATPEVAAFSGHGPWVSAYAGGVDVIGPYFETGYPEGYNGWAIWSGTSFAAATLTGWIAARVDAGRSARAVADELITNKETRPAEIAVWDVNGSRDVPYIQGLGIG
ncbi:S8 family peptidase [Saccharothrix deserti]|uniref:S8 family peptidase n=1 Tax=Saccharothrix deserti TaxID=2593674 RepID=UPI00131EA03E|nr:S8 family serine peptidase [Saccharothrix deserti]